MKCVIKEHTAQPESQLPPEHETNMTEIYTAANVIYECLPNEILTLKHSMNMILFATDFKLCY